MLFKPNFCCNCGVKIERAEWGVLTSRRFCEVCAVENKEHDWLPRAVVAAGILAGVFGLGAYMGGGPSPQMHLKAGEDVPSRKFAVGTKGQPGIKAEDRTKPPVPEIPSAAEVPNGGAGEDVRSQERPASAVSEPPVHYCGAMTKKGKPCSRRVKVKGRCWQHTGQPAALVSQSVPDVY